MRSVKPGVTENEKPKRPVSIPAMCWRTAASTSCRKLESMVAGEFRAAGRAAVPAERARKTKSRQARREYRALSPSRPFILAPGSDVVADGCDSAGRNRQLYAVASFGAAASGLSDDPNFDLLSGSESGGGGHDGDRSAGTAVRATAGLEPDDLEQLRRVFGHRVCSSISA